MKKGLFSRVIAMGLMLVMVLSTAAFTNVDKSQWNQATVTEDFCNTEDTENDVSANQMQGNGEDELAEYFSNVYCQKAENNQKGGIITNPVTYLHNTVGKSTDKYTCTSKILSGVTRSTCSSLGGGNNCTLTALYNIMNYYKAKGYSKIPESSKMYSIIKTQATKLGYTPSNGLPVTKNNNLVKNTWRSGFGYSSGNGSTNYLWTASTLKKAIDNSRPYIFSLASGVYYNHSIAVYGYKVYTNTRTNKKYTFLVVADGWSTSARYLAITGESYTAGMTSITPPSTK